MTLHALHFTPFKFPEDVPQFHSWATLPYAKFWNLTGKTLEEVTESYRTIWAEHQSEGFWGMMDGRPVCYIEVYDPKNSPLKDHISIQNGDKGFNFFLAPLKGSPVHNFSQHVFKESLSFVFNRHNAKRILVEPDVRNSKIHRMNRTFGFHHSKRCQFKNFEGFIGICTEAAFRAIVNKKHIKKEPFGNKDKGVYQKVARFLIRKMLSEFAHERMIQPVEISRDIYCVETDNPSVKYLFSAKKMPLDHWLIDVDSIRRHSYGTDSGDLHVKDIVLDFSRSFSMTRQSLDDYKQEIQRTFYSLCFKCRNQLPIQDILVGDYTLVEQSMIEGHPVFIANSSRRGFDREDYLKYSPEAAEPFALIWVAVSKSFSLMNCLTELTYDSFVEDEIDQIERERLENLLRREGVLPKDYYYVPVHPWQWKNKIEKEFIKEQIYQDIVYLGETDEKYLPQQSIRTLLSTSQGTKRYIKVALSITNMGGLREFGPDDVNSAAPVSEFLLSLLGNDSVIRALPFEILAEEIAIGYFDEPQHFKVHTDVPKFNSLACLYRENPLAALEKHQTLRSMASLLYVDFDGHALLPEIINASGLSINEWLKCYFSVYLTPLVHCFYRHKIKFRPHGENVILVFENNIPVKSYIKDLVDEVSISGLNQDQLDDNLNLLSLDISPDIEMLEFFTTVFDGFFRFITAILFESFGFAPDDFWLLVAKHLTNIFEQYPEYKSQFSDYDFFCKEFKHLCLNRLQMRNCYMMINTENNRSKSLTIAGLMQNPLADYV
ncbi:MAG: GNAT family N-acetyltransferase [Cellvibrionales bacterium]|nr:GNAT family N-acetyltransferase [Cellvibrionales bacterium]